MAWKNKSFGDCAELIRDSVQPSETLGLPYVGLEHISQGQLSLLGFGKADDVISTKSRFRKGDILFGKLRPYFRKVIIAPFDGVCSTDIWVVRAKPGTDQKYLFYWMASNEFVENSSRASEGTKMPRAQWEFVEQIRQEVPNEPEQRAIAGILGALDDKIEHNRRMNRTLASMARAVFAEMMKDEGGRMKVGTVGEDFSLTMGQSPPGETYNEEGEGVPFFQGRADFGFRYPVNRVYCTAPTRFAKAGDTLVSVRAPVGDVNMAKEKCAIGRGVAAVRHKTGSRSYTYYAMKFLEEDFARFEAEGTVFGSINKADFQNLEIGIPTTEQIEQFEKTYYPIDQMIENNEKESRTLARLRDALLPKLMKGEVRVK
jgi:type I restriction enzyme S subunit